MSSPMTPATKPFLLRAIYDWCVEGGFTPYIVVQVDEATRVPLQHIRDGQIVLNIAPYATNRLLIDSEAVSCQARFSGKVETLYVPIGQVLAIYARENGQGLAFQPGVLAGSAMELGGAFSEQADSVTTPAEVSPLAATGPADADAAWQDEEPAEPDTPPPAPAGRGSHLRRIK